MAKEKIYSPRWRFRKAYTTTLIVLGSYLWLLFLKKIRGKRFYEKRLPVYHARNAERVKAAILELKGLFIKIGQLLSILGNFLPEAFQKPLDALQDRIPPRPFDEVKARMLREFGKSPAELFARFDEVPIASASIGQAHRARLHDGTEVVVKVQHAHIEQVAQVDLRIIKKLTQLLAWVYDIKGMDYLYTQVRTMIEAELDFTQEARSMQRIAGELKELPHFIVPEVHAPYSTLRALTTTWHDGTKIANTRQLDDWQLDRRDLAVRIIQAYCLMVFKNGFYHADPHPGNILVKQDGTLVLLDFGAVAELSDAMREGIPRLIEAAVKNDTGAMIAAARAMGFIAAGREAEEMAEKMIDAMRNFLQNEVQFEGLNFKEVKVNPLNSSLFDLVRDIGLGGISSTVQVPKDWVLLNRTITLLLGLSATLDPSLNPLDVVRPYAKELVSGEKDNLLSLVTGLLRRSVSTTLGLPDELHRVLQKIEKNKLETRTPDIRDGAKLLYQAGQQFVFAMLAIAAATFGYLFHAAGETTGTAWGFGLSGLFLLLLLRSLHKGSRIRKKLD